MSNLVSNAIKFSKPGDEIKVSLEFELPGPEIGHAPDITLLVKVCDQGLGINDQDRQNLFKPNFRSLDSKSREVNPKSNGLGLHISKRIAQSLGGDLTLDPDYVNGC